MSEDIRRKYTPEQTARMRQEIVARIAQRVGQVFEQHPQLRSAVMLVAQYWNDEAQDAVHGKFIFSMLAVPDLKAVQEAWDRGNEDSETINLPAGMDYLSTHDELGYTVTSPDWDDNGDAIALFAAFTKEGCDQCMSPVESGAPYAVFRRSPTGVETVLVGEMRRPWLDGVMPEVEREDVG